MFGSTNSKKDMNGGGVESTVLAHDTTGLTEYDTNKKVLLRYALPSATKKQEFSINATSSSTGGQTYVQPVWFNNNLFCVFAGFNNNSGYVGSFAYAYNGSTWSKTALTGVHNVYGAGSGITFRWLDDVGMLVRTFSTNCNHGIIDSSGQFQQLFSGNSATDWDRVGLLGGVYWDSKYSYGSGQDSGIYADGTRLTTNAYTKGHYLDVDNKLVLYSESNVAKISAIGDDDISITATYNSGDIGTSAFVGCTGLAEGDYVFFADDYTKELCNNFSNYNSSTNVPYGTVASSYSVFKINSSHQLVPINSSDTLYPYINIDKSLWRFDNRNNCLVIGTTSNVYVLEFNSGVWKLLASNMPLPDNNSGAYIYNATLSPDKTKLAVYAGDTNQYAQGLFIYDISSGYTWTVVDDSAQNYDSLLSYTGVFTGSWAAHAETGEIFAVVGTALPPVINVVCTLDMGDEIYVPELSIE